MVIIIIILIVVNVNEICSLNKNFIVHLSGNCYFINLPKYQNISDNTIYPLRCPIRIFENGKELPYCHSTHSDISDIGNGRYSLWEGGLFFSSSDNSNPINNHKRYVLININMDLIKVINSPYYLGVQSVNNLDHFKVNIICHLAPKRGKMLDMNIDWIKKYLNLFNNKKIIAIVISKNEDYLSPVKVKQLINDKTVTYIEVDNDQNIRDSTSFYSLLQFIKSTDPLEFTFYCHGKGISRPNDPYVSVWVELMYYYNLHYARDIVSEMYSKKYLFSGIFRSFYRFPFKNTPLWHYAGSFYWFRNKYVFESPLWEKSIMENIYVLPFITEMWPGIICPNHNKSFCPFADHSNSLYEKNYKSHPIKDIIKTHKSIFINPCSYELC